MKEDQDTLLLIKQATAELGEIVAGVIEHGDAVLLAPGPDGEFDAVHLEGREGLFIMVWIGRPGELTEADARFAGKAWQEILRRYPEAFFLLGLLGFKEDEDPRPLWEIGEAADYIRWFARYAGLDDIDVAHRLIGKDLAVRLGPAVGTYVALAAAGINMALLACCGAFGAEWQHEFIKDFRPWKVH